MPEVLVAFLLGTMVLGIVFGIVWFSTRSFGRNRTVLDSLQAAHHLTELLKRDLSACYFEANRFPIVIPDDRMSLTFHRVDEDETDFTIADPFGSLETVTYRFDPDTNRVQRNGKDLTFGRFERVRFVFRQPRFVRGQPPSYGNYVVFRITSASEAVIEANRGKADQDPERITRNVVTLITAVAVAQKATRDVFPFWNRNPEPSLRPR